MAKHPSAPTTVMEEQSYRRHSICVGCPEPDAAIHEGEGAFCNTLKSLYEPGESAAIELLVNLKDQLRTTTNSNDFYNTLSQGLTRLLGAQFVFISKRIIKNVNEPAIEMPPIGEPGSCLMALSWYFDDGHGNAGSARDVTYHAFSCPCAYMRNDKVFLVPNGLNELFPSNPNALPFPCESYLGIPLFFQGKCIAHFGIMWSVEGTSKRTLGWGYIEMICHAVEDLILKQVLKATDFGNVQSEVNVVPHNAVDSNQSLKTYARCLSHELRTPMHGVVGMLDIMYATVQEAVESNASPADKQVFQTLKDNIELVQVSSRRAVEAADNVVQAYDLGMGHPEASTADAEVQVSASSFERPLVSPLQGHKRRVSWTPHEHPAKHRLQGHSLSSERKHELDNAIEEATRVTRVRWSDEVNVHESISGTQPVTPPISGILTGSVSFPHGQGLAYSNVRDVVEYVVKESLRIGKHFDAAVVKEVEGGQIFDIITSANGDQQKKTIEWTVDSDVPEIIWLDEKDLAKLVSCVFQNALKFTDEGRVSLKVTASSTNLIIMISDTGPGIPESFRPNIFKPFSREDETITRHNEGLGLGLLVAKGLSRKLKGDLTLTRCSTDGIDHGSVFEICLPRAEVSRSNSPESPMTLSAPNSPYLSKVPKLPETHVSTSLLPRIPIMPHHATAVTPKPASSGRMSKLAEQSYTKNLAATHPLTLLVAEDNNISRKILVSMLVKLGYDAKTQIYEAADGTEAVKQVAAMVSSQNPIELIIMDLWMPSMDGYEASERILGMYGAFPRQMLAKRSYSEPDGLSLAKAGALGQAPTIYAVTADATDGAAMRATKAGMEGFMTKPFKILDLERLLRDGWSRRNKGIAAGGGSSNLWPNGNQMEVVTSA